MRRLSLGTTGLIATSLIALMLFAFAAPVGHSAPARATPLVVPHITATHSPLYAPPGKAEATASFTNNFSTNSAPFWVLPINVTWTTTIKNATISAVNLTSYLNVTFKGHPAFAVAQNGSADGSSCASATVCSYKQTITTAAIMAKLGSSVTQFPAGQYIFKLTSWAHNSSSVLAATKSVIQAADSLAPLPAFGKFLSPVGTEQAGTLAISGNYSGYYLTGATVTVRNASNGLVYTNGVFGPGLQYAFAVFWTVVTPGNYTLILTLTEQWGVNLNFSAVTTVTASGAASSVKWTNNSWGVLGLGPGPSAAVIVTLGVLIGMIVMALVGRPLFGGARAAPAQPWSGEKPTTPGAGGTFECGVCHQSFASEDLLKEHSKSQHGITM